MYLYGLGFSSDFIFSSCWMTLVLFFIFIIFWLFAQLQTKATVAASALRQFGERWIGVRVSPFATLPHSSKGGLDWLY
jgi:flagellar biogenesis protein FliO